VEHGVERPSTKMYCVTLCVRSETAVRGEVGEISQVAVRRLSSRDDLVSFGEQAVAEVASQEAGRAR
jgi:hypothetical protein